jgi:DNA-binding Lrp family transcriptional regulator
MEKELDKLDRKILQYVCGGIYSYEELGKLCNAGRNTIYRRIDRLEKLDIITRKIVAYPNYEKLNLSAVVIGLNVNTVDLDRAIDFLKKQNHIKFLWKTYGTHDIILMLVCNKGEVGKCIYELKKSLENSGIHLNRIDSSTSISWDKIDLNPF